MRIALFVVLLSAPGWASDKVDPVKQLEVAKTAFSGDFKAWNQLAATLEKTDHPMAWVILWEWLYETKDKVPHGGDVVYLDRATLATVIVGMKLNRPVTREESLRYLQEHQELAVQEVDWSPLLNDAMKRNDLDTIRTIGRLMDCTGIPTVREVAYRALQGSPTWRTLEAVLARVGDAKADRTVVSRDSYAEPQRVRTMEWCKAPLR